jgi:hypothetical protein
MSQRKREKLETVLTKLQKLLPNLGNANANEAAVALQKINSLLATVKLDWHDLMALMLEKEPSFFDLLAKLFAKDEDILVSLGEARAKFFHSSSAAYADVIIDGHRNTLPLSGAEFTDWLSHQFYIEMKETPRKAPSLTAMRTALRALSAIAKFEGEQQEVVLRAAKRDEKIYLDVGDPEWTVIEIDSARWRIISDPPVHFRRVQGQQALPIPQAGGSIAQLRPLVNLTEDGFVLFVSCILDALCPGRPHPVLFLAGEEGSAKSTAARIARSLIDPNKVPLRNLPTTVRDLFVGANGSNVLAFDNVSNVPPAISDALCQVTTGTGFGTRKLYTDTAQNLIGEYRSVIINGLQNAIDRPDLADRAVIIPMQRVAAEQRRSETEMLNRFELDRAKIFGALLDCVVCGLRRLPHVRLSRLPPLSINLPYLLRIFSEISSRAKMVAEPILRKR